MNRLDYVFLYEHTPEAMQALESGEAHFSTGGLRRKDGTLLEMSKPAKMSIEDLKAMLAEKSDDTHIARKLQELSETTALSERNFAELENLQWANNILAKQNYVMTYEGFRTVIQGVERLNKELAGLKEYMREKDIEAIQKDAQRYTNYMKTDAGNLRAVSFDVTNSNIAEHLDDTAAFLKSMVTQLENESDNAYVLLQTLVSLLTPFAYIVRKFSALYYYQNGFEPGDYEEWVDTIRKIIGSKAVRNYMDYFLSVRTAMTFRERTTCSRQITNCMKQTLSAVKFEEHYIHAHTKEEYLGMPDKIAQQISEDRYWNLGNGMALLV